MQRLLLYSIVGILLFSTICSQWSIQDDVKFNSALTDLAEESKGEIEDTDIRLFSDQLSLRGQIVQSNDLTLTSFSKELVLFNFLEVPIPPPKGESTTHLTF